jgi:hypothetical protein
MDPSAPGWYPDPYGRHERRYWSGIRWSRHVDDGGYRTEDPVDTGPVATVPIERPEWPDSMERPAAPFVRPDTFVRPAHGERPERSGSYQALASGQMPRVEMPERGEVRSSSPNWVLDAQPPRRVSPTPEPRRPIGLIAGAVALVLIAGASFVLLRKKGDDAGPSDAVAENDPVMVAVTASMKEKAAGSIPDEKAGCMADALVNVVGPERFTELGVVDGADPVLSMDEADKDTAIPKAFECLDNDELVAFMGATWRDANDEPYPPAITHCVFSRWQAGLGRERLVVLYRSFAAIERTPMEDILNENEMVLVNGTLAQCAQEANASTTVATAAPGTP